MIKRLQGTGHRVQSLIVVFFSFYILHSTFYILPLPVFAQSSDCPTPSSNYTPIQIADDGKSFLTLGPSDNNPGIYTPPSRCVTGNRAIIPQFGIPTYPELKSIFYDQALTSSRVNKHNKEIGNKNHLVLNNSGSKDHLYHVEGDLSIEGSIAGNDLAVIFIDGNLNIKDNIIQNPTHKGFVFVVAGDINIDQAVSRVDAILIAYREFCSAYNYTNNLCPGIQVDSPQLIVNGSVIYLNPNPNATPKFMRSFDIGDNLEPAEKLVYDPKYLVILKDIMTRDLTVWKEDQ